MGENSYLHDVIDSVSQAPTLTILNAPTKAPLALPQGSLMEQLLGHRSGGTLKNQPLQFANAASGGRVAGIATAMAAASMTDTTANWVTNVPAPHNTQNGKGVFAHGGTLPGATAFQFDTVSATADQALTLTANWQTTPTGAGWDYFLVPLADLGTVTAETTTTLTDSTKAWVVNCWMGFFVAVGTAINRILSNTATVLTVESVFLVTPSNGNAYGILMPWQMNYSDYQRGHSRGIGQWGGFGGDGSNTSDV
jgi:hypothetical protein